MKKYIIFTILTFALTISVTHAQSYTNTNNTIDGSMTNTLINIAVNRVKDFQNHNFIIFQNDYSFYIMVFDDFSYSNNVLSFKNSTIIRYFRDSNYNSNYQYQIYNEDNTSFTSQYLFVSNLDINNSISSSTFTDFKNGKVQIYLLMLILALIFASFLLKERSSY